MNAEPSLRTIFSEALELGEASARARYLDQACGEGTALRRQVDALLEAHDVARNAVPWNRETDGEALSCGADSEFTERARA